MAKKAVRGLKPKIIKEESKALTPVVQTINKPEEQEAPPIDPIYLLTPLERANALPDHSKTFTREKHIQMINNLMNTDLATINRITKHGAKYASVHELQILDIARESLNQKNEDRHKLSAYMWERTYGKNPQKIEHSGGLNGPVNDAYMMDTFGIDSITKEEMEQMVQEVGLNNDLSK